MRVRVRVRSSVGPKFEYYPVYPSGRVLLPRGVVQVTNTIDTKRWCLGAILDDDQVSLRGSENQPGVANHKDEDRYAFSTAEDVEPVS